MVGKDGARDNVAALVRATQALVPRGTVVRCEIAHDTGCPCTARRRPLDDCTCTAVDVTLRAERP